MRRRRRNPADSVMGWASKHWILTGLFIVPALIMLPIELVKAVRGPEVPRPPAPDPGILPTPPAVPKAVPQDLGGGIVFVPGVLDT